MTALENFNGTRVIPVGGAGEFGANATIIQTGTTTILVDFGIMFPPDQTKPGVEFYINDPELLLEAFPDLSAVFVTHAHEDHIGGLGFLLSHISLPIYTMPYTAHMINKSLKYFDLKPDIHQVCLNEPVIHGDLSVEFVGVTHSIVHACALCVRTLHGTVVHTGDFKVDPLPADHHPFQSERFSSLGKEGVDLLIMDSTNALTPGFCPSDHEILPFIEAQIQNASGRVFFTTFSSHMPRIKKLKQIARRTGRKIALIGHGFQKHFESSLVTRYMDHGSGVVVTANEVANLPDHQVIYVVTGSQAEQQSALVRIGKDGFKGIKIKAGDRVIFSSKSIPGNERKIALLASDLQRKGVEVISRHSHHIHTSGHGYRDDIAYMVSLTQPKTVAPIHGEFHQLLSHYRWLKSLGDPDRQVLLIEDGQIIALENGEATLSGVIETRLIPIDGGRNLPLSPTILRERKDMMYSGLLLINAQIGEHVEDNFFEVTVNGMVEEAPGNVASLVVGALQAHYFNTSQTEEEWAEVIYLTSRRAIKKLFFGRPLIKIVLNDRIAR